MVVAVVGSVMARRRVNDARSKGASCSAAPAAGKVRRRKRWACAHRDCERVFEIDGISDGVLREFSIPELIEKMKKEGLPIR